jgi:thiamine transporter ThiT
MAAALAVITIVALVTNAWLVVIPVPMGLVAIRVGVKRGITTTLIVTPVNQTVP